MKKYIVPALLGILSLASCDQKETAPAGTDKFVLSDTMQHMIELDSVRYSGVGDEVNLSGEVSFDENNVIKVFPRSSGQVTECKVSLGDPVHKGQVLAVIRSADIAGEYSDLSSANADIAIAKRQLDNAKSLYDNGISSEREYTEAKQNYEKTLAARNKVQSQISINGGSSSNAGGQYVLTSPIDGYLVEKKVNAGSFIRPDAGDNIFTISDLKTVWINANVYEADIAKVKEGFGVAVRAVAYPDKVFNGKIDKLSQVLDPQSKTLRARVVIPNAELLLKPDMFVKVSVANQETGSALCVPATAPVSQDGKEYLVLYNANDDLQLAEVNVLKTVGDRAYVSGDVRPGQRIVVKNQLLIFNALLEE